MMDHQVMHVWTTIKVSFLCHISEPFHRSNLRYSLPLPSCPGFLHLNSWEAVNHLIKPPTSIRELEKVAFAFNGFVTWYKVFMNCLPHQENLAFLNLVESSWTPTLRQLGCHSSKRNTNARWKTYPRQDANRRMRDERTMTLILYPWVERDRGVRNYYQIK